MCNHVHDSGVCSRVCETYQANLLYKKTLPILSSQAGKIILTASQFTWCRPLTKPLMTAFMINKQITTYLNPLSCFSGRSVVGKNREK